MSAIVKLKNRILEKNPIAVARRKRMRTHLTNQSPSFLCPNCIGGILFHDLGLEFRSPTVNLSMNQRDFVKYVLHYDKYMAGQFEFFKHDEFICPCAHLSFGGLDTIDVIFTHYNSPEHALEKWYSRSTKMDKDNVFVFLEERDGLTEEDIRSLANIKARGLVVFTYNNYPDIPYCVKIKKYENKGEVGNILKRSYLDDSREYEKYFNFVKWFNEADGDFRKTVEFVV